MNGRAILLRRARAWLLVFVAGLVLSGITAFPLEWETGLLVRWLGVPADVHPDSLRGLERWALRVHDGLRDTYARHPFVAYGTDWLAFAHVVIAVFFIGPIVDPVRNRWVVSAGMIACALVIPLALVCGPIRGIPLGWRLLDGSFGILGLVPLALCRRAILQLGSLSP